MRGPIILKVQIYIIRKACRHHPLEPMNNILRRLYMKKANKVLLFTAFFIAVNVGYAQTVAPPYEVGTWQGFRSAAISYTFDDGCSNQFTIAIPMFNEF